MVGTTRGLDRLVAFLDAVVAIGITRLVLPLVELAGERDLPPSVGSLLGAHEIQLGGVHPQLCVGRTALLVLHAKR